MQSASFLGVVRGWGQRRQRDHDRCTCVQEKRARQEKRRNGKGCRAGPGLPLAARGRHLPFRAGAAVTPRTGCLARATGPLLTAFADHPAPQNASPGLPLARLCAQLPDCSCRNKLEAGPPPPAYAAGPAPPASFSAAREPGPHWARRPHKQADSTGTHQGPGRRGARPPGTPSGTLPGPGRTARLLLAQTLGAAPPTSQGTRAPGSPAPRAGDGRDSTPDSCQPR